MPIFPVHARFQIRLFVCGSTRFQTGEWGTANVCDPFWRLYLNQSDGAALLLADGAFALQSQRLYIVPAYVPFSCFNDTDFEHFYVHFDVLGFSRQMYRTVFERPVEVPISGGLLEDLMDLRAEVEATRQHAPDIALECRLLAIVTQAVSWHVRALDNVLLNRLWTLSKSDVALHKVVEYIEENLGAKLTNDRLAKICFLSEDHFARRFRQAMGQTPAAYIRERRLAAAAQQLLFTEDSIEAIAASVGLGNRFYFSRVFAEQVGLPPAAYRKSERP